MTLSWTPTPPQIYKLYEIVNGTRVYKGQTTAGSYTINNLKRGTHDFVVTASNAAGESLPSNEVTFIQRHKTMNKKVLILLIACHWPLLSIAQAQNVQVTNNAAHPVPVTFTGGTGAATNAGAANYANGQVTTSTTASTLVAARATRRSVSVVNTDAAITVYIGAATVTAANGFPLKAGQSISIDSTALIQVIAASGTPIVAYFETYD